MASELIRLIHWKQTELNPINSFRCFSCNREMGQLYFRIPIQTGFSIGKYIF